MAHPYHYSSYPYPSYYDYDYDYGPSAEDYPSASASASASAARSGRCEHCGKYGHASEKCWFLSQNAHKKPAHWLPPPQDMDTTSSSYASTSRRPPPRPSNLQDSMTELRDRVHGGAASSSSTHPTRSPQDRRSPPPPPPRAPYASTSSSSARPERGPNGIAVDSGWGRRASILNEGARSPRQAEVLDPRRRGASVRRPAEEGEIMSEVSSLRSEAQSRDRGGPPHNGENRTRRDPRLEERQKRRGSDESARKHQAHTGSSADLQQHLQDQFEVVERRNEHLSTIVNRPWPQQPYSRTQLASTLFSAITRLVPLAEELDRKQVELDDAVQWVELNKDEAGAQETISQFEKETRAELQKAVEEARSAMEPVQREFTQALMQLVDYKWMIEAAQQSSAKNILHICQEMQDEYRTAFQKLDLDRKASIERASREASDQPRRISPRPIAAEDAPPAGAEASTSATATAPARTTTTEGAATAPSARTDDAVRALRNALKGMQRRLDRMEEETDATNEEAHAMQAEMVDNVAWEAREAVKAEIHAMRERKRRRVEVSEGTGEGTPATAATAGQEGARTASPAAPREDQDETMTQVASTSAVPPPAERPSSSSLTSAAPASTSIDLEALSASLQPRIDSSIETIRTEILELAHQKAREDASAIEERVKSAFKAVEQEFTKVRAHTEERFDFLAAEMLRKDNEWKERFARYEAMQSETNEGLKRLAGGHASTRQLLMAMIPTVNQIALPQRTASTGATPSAPPHPQPRPQSLQPTLTLRPGQGLQTSPFMMHRGSAPVSNGRTHSAGSASSSPSVAHSQPRQQQAALQYFGQPPIHHQQALQQQQQQNANLQMQPQTQQQQQQQQAQMPSTE
ncbi:hypothetical protein BDZ90DRAFT_276423 [Jaminaea rosea]|uniref:CCHC-type domain-containing protein n=1 Tax=Jaminaea rosea TaxID=1569628 RepID=A0A316UY31_9BASI|nr:hypothetical protein BDZ90DRAFT_276423 [Jaminaea rosea]PWN29904.1 hypothetical protein BDZ90DRAFT_276423 [Jaminaea rosea]